MASADIADALRESFLQAVPGSADWAGRSPPGDSSLPQSYWTVKQKSLISSVEMPVVKVRPIVSHCRHPLGKALKRVARTLALLVSDARLMVMER